MLDKKNKLNHFLLGTVGILIILGIIMIASASFPLAQEEFGNAFHFLRRHIIFLIIGLILGFLAFKISLKFLEKQAFYLILINILFLILVFVPGIGRTVGGASRWVDLGIFSFQPSEFLKLAFFIYLAAWLASPKRKREIGQSFLLFLIIIGIIALILTLQPDIGTLAVIVFSGVVVYFLSTMPIWHILAMLSIIFVSLTSLIKIAPYRLNRLLVFLNPEMDPMGVGFHLRQALIAIGSGGILGIGLGLGRQKFGFLPHPIHDSIFAVFAEETGFLGSLLLISLFLTFAWLGIKIVKASKDKFHQFLALGVTFWISIQAFVNIGSMIGILPLTGIPLPFISYGGSHLIVELIGVGILFNISKQT